MILGLKNTLIAVIVTTSLGWVYSQYQFKQGIELGKQSQIALQAEIDTRVKEAEDKLTLAVVEGLKQIEVKNVTINNKAIKEVIKEPVYSECKLTPDGVSNAVEANRPRK
jgi:hypothetical protein